MKTLVFCTAFAYAQDSWWYRYRRWVEALYSSGLHFHQLLLVYDGSAVLPDWPDLTLLREREGATAENTACDDPLILYHFEQRLGRAEPDNFEGGTGRFHLVRNMLGLAALTRSFTSNPTLTSFRLE